MYNGLVFCSFSFVSALHLHKYQAVDSSQHNEYSFDVCDFILPVYTDRANSIPFPLCKIYLSYSNPLNQSTNTENLFYLKSCFYSGAIMIKQARTSQRNSQNHSVYIYVQTKKKKKQLRRVSYNYIVSYDSRQKSSK